MLQLPLKQGRQTGEMRVSASCVSGRCEVIEQVLCRMGYLVDRGLEYRLVGPGRLPVAADLAHVLEGGCLDLLVGDLILRS